MDKLVVLKLEGDLQQQGFRVNLEVSQQGQLPEIEAHGYLPKSPKLVNYLTYHWEHKYRSLGSPARLKAKKIIYDGSFNEKIQACYQSGLRLREVFNRWLNSEQFLPLDKRIREVLNQDERIRILIRSEDINLQKLPWHLWDLVERYPQAEVVMSSYDLERTRIANPVFSDGKLRVLAILGHSEGIDIDTDRRYLESLPNAEVIFLVEPQHQEINEQLWKYSWDIIFFAGHSETEGETGRIYINKAESLTIDELRYGLKKAVARGVQLAIFNSCDGLALAKKLNELHIPQIIAMRELVPDRVAQDFLKYFLTSLAERKPFDCAVREARERLQGLESQFPCASWLPTTFQNPTLYSVELEKNLKSTNFPKENQLFLSRFIVAITKWNWQAFAASLLLTLALLTGIYLVRPFSFNYASQSLISNQESLVVNLNAEQALWKLMFTQPLAQLNIIYLEQNGQFLTNSKEDYQCNNSQEVQGIISSSGQVDLVVSSPQLATELSFQSNRFFLEAGKIVIRGNYSDQSCQFLGVFELREV